MTVYQKTGFSTAFVSDSLLSFDPVIVIGSPRSGTSIVARLLQEELGVMMDEGPIRKDKHNPYGYYEDQKLIAINKVVLNRWQMGSNNEQKIDKEWAIRFAQWIVMRAGKYEKWGFKEPRMVGFIQWTLQFFNKPVFIWTIRKEEQIIKSQVDKLGYASVIAKAGVAAYKKLIKQYIPKDQLHIINLSSQRSEKRLTKELQGILNGCR